MADLKISELPSLGALVANNDLLVIVDTNNTATKSIAVSDLFGNIPVDVDVNGNLIVAGNTTISANTTLNGYLRNPGPFVVSSNNAATEFGASANGTIVWDSNYIYIAVSDTKIKRVALQDF